MSKKKKNKKSKNRWFPDEYKYTQKKDKKSKKLKKEAYKKPKYETVKESLGKKEIKTADKIVSAKPEVNKKLIELQKSCNHAGNLISVQEYKERSLTPLVYTPMLEAMLETFGDKTLICESCYQVVASPENIDPKKLRESVAYLYAAAMAVLPRKKLKSKEIKKINDLADDLNKWTDIIATFEKMANKGAFKRSQDDGSAVSTLNDVTSATPTAYIM